jgi:hypothetical protein
MQHLTFGRTALVGLLLGIASLAGAPGRVHAEGATAACDRGCLDGFMTRYLEALVAHDPSRLPIDPGARFTENSVPLTLGDGLWNTMTGLGKFKQYLEDISRGEVVFVGTIDENGQPAIFTARLKVAQQKIAEIDTMVVRFDDTDSPKGPEELDASGGPDPLYSQTLAPAQRRSRTEMIAAVNAYFDGLVKGSGHDIPFGKVCDRYNNATLTTNNTAVPSGILRLDCTKQIDTGFSKFVTRIVERRFPVVDEERGVVVAMGYFDHIGKMKTVRLSDGTDFTVPKTHQKPQTLMLVEFFKIIDGKFRRIDAYECYVTYGLRSGWH